MRPMAGESVARNRCKEERRATSMAFGYWRDCFSTPPKVPGSIAYGPPQIVGIAQSWA
jgi:hypothetical protein